MANETYCLFFVAYCFRNLFKLASLIVTFMTKFRFKPTANSADKSVGISGVHTYVILMICKLKPINKFKFRACLMSAKGKTGLLVDTPLCGMNH